MRDLLIHTAGHIADYREGVAQARVFPEASPDELRQALGGPLPAGLVASAGPRYFGFVTGGPLPAATAADLLVTGRDQLTFKPVFSPASAVIEEWPAIG